MPNYISPSGPDKELVTLRRVRFRRLYHVDTITLRQQRGAENPV